VREDVGWKKGQKEWTDLHNQATKNLQDLGN
jgi:hypothetical protein